MSGLGRGVDVEAKTWVRADVVLRGEGQSGMVSDPDVIVRKQVAADADGYSSVTTQNR